jgi:MFS transporter, ACS family, glucarate transporter
MATPAQDQVPITETPTRVRYWVIVFAVTLAVITYIDRVAMSFAAPRVMSDLGLTQVQMGLAFTAFVTSYALFEIPSGFMGDWMGPRKVLMRIVIWWSSFTALTGATWNFASLFTTEALFGAGEAGCFPNLTKAFTTWLPREERVRAQGILWLSARWGGAFTPPLMYLIFKVVSWRHAFMLFGIIGVVWATFFYRWFRDDPRDNKKINAAELELLRPNRELAATHGHVPWSKFLHSPTVWMLCAQYFCLSYGWYFYITWLPTYLQNSRGVEIGKSALLSMLPLFLGGLGSLVCGLASAPVARLTHSVARTRKLMAYIGFTGASALLILSVHLANPVAAMLAMGCASFCNDLVMPGSWGTCMDVGGKYAGTLSGTMNMMGNLGGAVSPTAIGFILRWTHNNWDTTFYVSAAVYFCGSFFWLLMDPVTPIEPADMRPSNKRI